jgi:hypothetical protein
MVGVPEKLRAVRHAQSRGIGLRRACALWGVSRSMTGYSHLLPVKDAPLVQTLVEVSRIHNTWGYRLVHGWVKGKVEGATIFRVRRLWKLHGLARPGRKRGRKLRTGARLKPLPTGPNAIWWQGICLVGQGRSHGIRFENSGGGFLQRQRCRSHSGSNDQGIRAPGIHPLRQRRPVHRFCSSALG